MINLSLPYPPTANTYYRHVGYKTLISEAPISLLRLLLADARQCYRNASCLPCEREAWRKRAKDLIRQINTLITLSKGDPIAQFVKEIKDSNND